MSNNEIRMATAQKQGWTRVHVRENGDLIGIPPAGSNYVHIGGSNDWAFVPQYAHEIDLVNQTTKGKMNIRAKITCSSILKTSGQEVVSFSAVVASGSDENKSYSKYTPNLGLTMTITNESVFGAFLPGKEYYLDFISTDVPKQQPVT